MSTAAARKEVGLLVRREVTYLERTRRSLHACPELSFREHRTAAFVEQELRGLGLQTYRPTATSVVAEVGGARRGPVLMLRADMDALPITEETGLPFAATNGAMHACGHDGHTAILLTVARCLVSLSTHLVGSVRLVFQHAEEPLPSGAPELVEAGVLDGVDAVFGLHLWAPLPSGQVFVRPGAMMASADYFDVVVRGKGGHGGLPHEVIDPISIGAEIVTSLNRVTARESDPLDPLVISVTGFDGGRHNTVVPDEVVLRGTVRAFVERTRRRAESRVKAISTGLAEVNGATAEVSFTHGPPPVVNDPELADAAARVVRRYLDPRCSLGGAPVMAGEDFAWYQRHAPGAFALIGASPTTEPVYPHHHPKFDIDESVLVDGVRLMLGMSLEWNQD